MALKRFETRARTGSRERGMCAKVSKNGIGGLWRACCQASRGLRGSYVCGVDSTMHCGGAGASACADSVGECRNAGELSVWA